MSNPGRGPLAMPDDLIAEETGRPSEDWYVMLDAWGAPQKGHRATVAELENVFGLRERWAYVVAIRYEAAPGSSQTDPATPHREDRYLSTVASPLTRANGKSAVVQEALSGTGGRSMLVGDGASDLAAAPDVDLFVGYTGVVERARVAAEADALVTGDSLAPILGLALAAAEEATLATTPYRDLIARSRAKIRAGELSMQKDPTP